MGATLYELAPGAPETRIHMHFGAEEMFFVLSGRPSLRSPNGEEELAPGDVVFCPEGRAGLHTFSNASAEPAKILALSAGGFPDVVAYPEQGYAAEDIARLVDHITEFSLAGLQEFARRKQSKSHAHRKN